MAVKNYFLKIYIFGTSAIMECQGVCENGFF